MATTCIENLISVRNACLDQSEVTLFLDDLGISLDKAASTADERYQDGMNLITSKVQQAMSDFISDISRGVDSQCDFDDLLCSDRWKTRIAKAVYYKAAGLIYYEVSQLTSNYNEFIHYKGEEGDAIVLAMFYDDEYSDIYRAKSGNDLTFERGKYQKELENMEYLKKEINSLCYRDCVGSRHQISIP